jgi:hypothetical protein
MCVHTYIHTYIGQRCSVRHLGSSLLTSATCPKSSRRRDRLGCRPPDLFSSHFVRPLPSAADVLHIDRENFPPSSTLMRNTTEHKVHTATCTPQSIRQDALRTGRIPLGHRVPTYQSPPVDLSPRGRTHHGRFPRDKCTNTSTPPVDL